MVFVLHAARQRRARQKRGRCFIRRLRKKDARRSCLRAEALYAGFGQFYELLGHTGAAPAVARGVGFGADVELSLRNVDAVLGGQLVHDVEITVLVRPEEGDGKAEARGKGHEFLPRVAFVQVAAVAVFPAFLDEVAAVARGVHGKVAAVPVHASFQNGLERCKVVVVAAEAQIVDEQNELERVAGKRLGDVGNLVELILLHFHKAQALVPVGVDNGLHRAALARARVAVQEHVVHGPARKQGLGVGNDLGAFSLVTGELVQRLRVGVAHRHKMAVLHREHAVAREHAVTCDVDARNAFMVGLGKVEFARLPAGQKARIGQAAAYGLAVEGGKFLEELQFMFQAFGKAGGNRRAAAAGAHVDVFILQKKVEQVGAPVVVAGEQLGGKGAVGVHAGRGVGHIGVEQGLKAGNDGVGKDVAENNETAELEAVKRQEIHERSPSKSLGKYRTAAQAMQEEKKRSCPRAAAVAQAEEKVLCSASPGGAECLVFFCPCTGRLPRVRRFCRGCAVPCGETGTQSKEKRS